MLKLKVSPKHSTLFVKYDPSNSSRKPNAYWENKENIHKLLEELSQKYNLNTPEEWNSITQKYIQSIGGGTLLKKYSLYELKCMACPEGKSIFKHHPQPKPLDYWENKDNVLSFLSEIKEKYNFDTSEDWNSLTQRLVKSNGGNTLLNKYSIYDLKCIACPEGKSMFRSLPSDYWENKGNILNFLSEIKQKFNLYSPEHWNSITKNNIQSNGGGTLLKKHTMYELKCMACPEGKLIFNKSNQSKYWENKENIQNFLSGLKEKYNLISFEDWNSITQKHILSNGGGTLLNKYSMYDIKCMAFPEGKSKFNKPNQSSGYWENKENVQNFLLELKEKYNLNTIDDWSSITQKHIQSNGGGTLLTKYSIFKLKCMACPEGKLIFNDQYKPVGYWENKENIHNFLNEIKEKYNLNIPEDWNSITRKHILSNGGGTLLHKYSMHELKCMACPEGKLIFNNPPHPSGYWENKENIHKFFSELAQKYNLNTPEDWNSLTTAHIQSNRGTQLLQKYSIYELKCMACPEGKSIFKISSQYKPSGYWENKDNIMNFISEIKEKYNLNTPEDWKRVSKYQLTSQGGWWLFKNKNNLSNIKIQFDSPNTQFISLKKLIPRSNHKRSSQRWLFLQIQKLFPHEEIVEDYYHSEISRISGSNVQFDIYMMQSNIAIEYHGKQHYEDIPAGFSTLETNKYRDLEKETLCQQHGIQLIVIPYWWDNKLDSLRSTLYSKINQTLISK